MKKIRHKKKYQTIYIFIFCSNHEDDFIRINDTDSRLWIVKVDKIQKSIKKFDQKLEAEIPAFVEFIQNREIIYKSDTNNERLFFAPKDFQTDAFRNVVKNSEPQIIKDLRIKLEDNFLNTGQSEIFADAAALKMCFGLRENIAFVRKVVKDCLHKGELTKNKRFTLKYITPMGTIEEYKKQGRCFVFKREDFVKESKVINIEPHQTSIYDSDIN